MDEAGESQQLGFVAGVIERERILGFERILWRISRGNVFLRQADIEKPFTDPKTVRKGFMYQQQHECVNEKKGFMLHMMVGEKGPAFHTLSSIST